MGSATATRSWRGAWPSSCSSSPACRPTPAVGLIGKFFLSSAPVANGYTWLVVIAVLASVVSVYYYFRVVVHLWTRPSVEGILFHVPAGGIRGVGVSGLV